MAMAAYVFKCLLVPWSLKELGLYLLFLLDVAKLGVSSLEQHHAVCSDACGGEAYLSGAPTFCGLTSCFSWSYRYKSCSLKEHIRIKNAVIFYRISDSDCKFHDGPRETYVGNGGIYGFKNNVVWVDNGCRAHFSICYTIWFSFMTTNPTFPTSSTKATGVTATSILQPTSTKPTRVTKTTNKATTRTTRKYTRHLPITRPKTHQPPQRSSSITSTPKSTTIPTSTSKTSTSKTTKSTYNPVESSVASQQPSTKTSQATLIHSTHTTESSATQTIKSSATHTTESLATSTTERRKQPTRTTRLLTTPKRNPSTTIKHSQRSTHRYSRSTHNPKLSTQPSNTTPCVLCPTINSTRKPSLETAPSSISSYTPATNGHESHTGGPGEDDGDSKGGFLVTGIIILAIVVLFGFIILGVAMWRKRRTKEDANATKQLL